MNSNLGDKVKAALSLLLLQFKWDSSDGASWYSLHEMCNKSGNFISHSLGGNDGNLANKSLVDMEVEGQSRVVLLDDDSGRFLDSLGSDTLNKQRKWIERQEKNSQRQLIQLIRTILIYLSRTTATQMQLL